jgi:very-short-patch-repair endonuclease
VVSTEGHLTAAVLLAGPDAMLSHGSAAWWLGLTHRRPPDIHVITPRRRASSPGVVVHGRRLLERAWHRGIPVAPITEVLLDIAANATFDDLRYVLAQAEYRGMLDVDGLRIRDRPGSPALRAALERHQPQLAHTRSELERRLLRLCERHGLPVPEFNLRFDRWLLDAVWRDEQVVVEMDGRDGHTSWSRIRSDHERDFALRAAGWVGLRYTWEQLERTPGDVAQDIGRALAADVSR